jgi:hypothetical protein
VKKTLVAATVAVIALGGLSACSTPKHYSSCAAAQQAGASLPLHKGDAGYSKALDRDGDGVACE